MTTRLQQEVLELWKDKTKEEKKADIARKAGCGRSVVSHIIKIHKLYHNLETLLDIVLNCGKAVEDFSQKEMEALNAIDLFKESMSDLA